MSLDTRQYLSRTGKSRSICLISRSQGEAQYLPLRSTEHSKGNPDRLQGWCEHGISKFLVDTFHTHLNLERPLLVGNSQA